MKNKKEKIKLQRNIKNHFRVALFGSSRIKKNDPIYKQVKRIGEELAKNKIDIVTGGGPGLMEAANEGHKLGRTDDTVRSIGIGIKLPWEQGFNDYVEYKKEFERFSKRLDEFMLLSNAIIVAPGGIGTMLELFYSWQLVQVHHICDTPIILIGKQWKGFLNWMKKEPLKNNYLTDKDYHMVYCVKNEKEALDMINDAYKHWEKGGKNFCLNYEKYKVKFK